MSSRHRIEPGGRSLALVCAVLLSATLLGCTVTPARPLQTPDADALFNQVKTSPPALRAFLSAMPKGGDLHSHLSGAVYAESYLRWGIEDGLCVDAARLVLLRCDSEGIPLALVCGQDDVTAGPCHRLEDVQRLQTAVDDRTFRGRLVDALSTRNYQVYGRSGHDQFFAAFSAFGAASGRPGEMLAEVMRRAGAQNILYLELMVSARHGQSREAGVGLVVERRSRGHAAANRGCRSGPNRGRCRRGVGRHRAPGAHGAGLWQRRAGCWLRCHGAVLGASDPHATDNRGVCTDRVRVSPRPV